MLRIALVLLVVSLVLISPAPTAKAQASATRPTAREVAEKMEPCVGGQPYMIAALGQFYATAPVMGTTPDGEFGIKPLDRSPGSPLYLTFRETHGNGFLDVDQPSEFQRRVITCFYAAYLGQDLGV
jgi:hypothetical protein